MRASQFVCVSLSVVEARTVQKHDKRPIMLYKHLSSVHLNNETIIKYNRWNPNRRNT